MTADEMFRELGYEKEESPEVIIFCHESCLKAIAVRKQDHTCEAMWNFPDGSKICRMHYTEILACAQLIKEMGWDHESN